MAEVTIPLRSHEEAVLVLGPYDRYAKLLRQALDIEIYTRSGNLRLKGGETDVFEGRSRVEHVLGKLRKGRQLEPDEIETILLGSSPKGAGSGPSLQIAPAETSPGRQRNAVPPMQSTAKGLRARGFTPRTENQRRYLDLMEKHSLVFGCGAAGTGKTFLAVAAGVRALRNGEVRRMIVTRPVVEAGEHLGFLPGDLQAKLNPYLRPVYDALHSLVDHEDVARLEEATIIEIAPLAYMRGRTLSEAFVILDEAQNTTPSQMKMFLTRLGEGSSMVVTGDPSQTDLEPGKPNGLSDAVARLRGFQDVGLVEFGPGDIVRHPLVEQILKAYEAPPRDRRGGSTRP